jgi:tRNA pseudouridine13 synthase
MLDLARLPPVMVPLRGAPPGRGGGTLKAQPADFVVEEIPAYLPCGQGEHCYAWVEKEDVSAPELIRQVAHQAGVGEAEVGSAGQKDRRAITRQWLSLPASGESQFSEGLSWTVGDTGRITVLGLGRHTNRLRTGHLRGNRFRVVVRGRDPEADWCVRAALDAMEVRGFANGFGEQRFGDGLGEALGLFEGRRVRDGRRRRFLISAVQAALFNHWLERRVQDELAERPLHGDVLMKTSSGGVFWCDDPEADAPRVACGEVAITGPLHGWKLRAARGVPGEREAAILADAGLTLDAFRPFKQLALGARRAAVVRLNDCSIARHLDALTVAFELPAGSYATVALRLACGGDLREP